MLDWIKRIKSPPPVSAPPPEELSAQRDERLERLLIRLGSDRSVGEGDAIAEGVVAEVDRVAESAAPAETGAEERVVAVAETADAPPMPAEAPEINSALAAEISAAVDSLDSTRASETEIAFADDVRVDERLAEDDDSDGSADTGAILGATVEPVHEPVLDAMPDRSSSGRTATRTAAATSQMKIIAVCSQKGGSGKTTIAGHLAVQVGLSGRGPAVLIDTDPQGSLAEWWRVRKDDAPALAKVRLEELEDNLDELRSYGTTFAIIDTPPALTGSIQHVMSVADLIVIPARPSPHDLRAVGATVAMAKRAGKPFMFVLNGAAQRANITVQAVAALSEHGRVSPVILYQRTEYAASMIDGRTVLEAAPSGKSAQEVADLWNFVYAQTGMRAAA